MDHFESPPWAGKDTEPIVVPYKCKHEYDGGEFATYPERCGWMEEKLSSLEKSSGGKEEAEAFLQTWLFFGTLQSVFSVVSIPFSTTDFIHESAGDNVGKKAVTTRTLPSLLKKWENYDDHDIRRREYEYKHGKLKGLSDPERRRRLGAVYERREKIAAILTQLNDMVKVFCLNQDILCGEISTSILALGWMLTHEYDKIYRARFDGIKLSWPDPPYLKAKMRELKWCPKEISQIFHLHGIASQYYMAQTPSPRWEQDHSLCTETECHGRRGSNERYGTKHRKEGCGCSFSRAPKNVLAIVKAGGTPILSWKKGEDDKFHLHATAYEENSDVNYVAISHVWSDGLGNETANSLPRCQLHAIWRWVERLYARKRREDTHQNTIGPDIIRKPKSDSTALPKVAGFWIDTLCVPVGEANRKWRNLSISRMRKIYANAHRVLVLDAGIRKLHRVDSSLNTQGIEVGLSNWQHRLWTLQEGVLAQNLFFQYSDGPQSLRDATKAEDEDEVDLATLSDMTKPIKATTRLASYQRFGTRYLGMVPMLDLMGGKPKRLGADDYVTRFPVSLPPLFTRTTTKRSDETVCLSTLLDLDPSPLLKIHRNQYIHDHPLPHSDDPEVNTKLESERYEAAEDLVCAERMAVFFRMMGKSTSILPFNTYPRLNKPGFRWAPRTLLDVLTRGDLQATLHPNGIQSAALDHLAGARLAHETQGGLLVKYPGVIFRLDSYCRHLLRKLDSSTSSVLIASHDNTKPKVLVRVSIGDKMPDEDGFFEDGCDYYAIMCHSPPDHRDASRRGHGNGYGAAILGRLRGYSPPSQISDNIPSASTSATLKRDYLELEHMCRVTLDIQEKGGNDQSPKQINTMEVEGESVERTRTWCIL